MINDTDKVYKREVLLFLNLWVDKFFNVNSKSVAWAQKKHK